MSCLEVICSFDGNVNSIPRLNKIVVALNSLFEEEELRREMDRVMHQKIGEKITLAYEESLPKKVMILQSILSKFVTPTLEIALQKFSRFGLLIWCPVLSKNSFKLLLPFARILIHETLNLESIDEKIFEKMFSIYRDFAELLKFGSDLHKNEFADTFDACLSIWAKVAAEKAKKQINVVLEQKKGANKGEEKKKKQTTLGQIWTMEDVVSEAWSDGAMNVCGILISCHKSWEMLKYPCPERHMSFGTQLLALILNDVFPHYIKGFKSIIMDDSLFDHIEFVLAVNALCKSSKYLELFEATAESLQNQGKNGVCASTFKDLVDTAKDNVNEIVMDLITVFGKCQESKFNVFIKEKRFCHDNELLPEEHIYSGLQSYYSTEESQDPSHLLGYVNCLLKFIYENLDSEVEEKYNGLVKEKLFDILEDCFMSVDLKKHKRFLPQLIYAIEHSIEFRTTVKLGESQKLSRVKDNLWMQNADLCQLISKFYGELDLTSEENRGVFKAQISQTGNAIDFTLLSVANLVPRRDKKTLDFSLEVAVFPIPQSYKTNQSTKIYCQSDVRIFNLQDVDSLQKKDDTYYGKLLIPAAALKENLFLKILVYDHSVTRTNKVFRGIYLAPLESVSNQILAGDFYAFPEITPTHPNWDIFQEIKSRESSVASHAIKDIKCYMSEKRKISLTK